MPPILLAISSTLPSAEKKGQKVPPSTFNYRPSSTSTSTSTSTSITPKVPPSTPKIPEDPPSSNPQIQQKCEDNQPNDQLRKYRAFQILQSMAGLGRFGQSGARLFQ
jgi:hypothetical protein